MKPHLTLAAIFAAALTLSANAQTYTEDNKFLNIPANTDYYEEYINRTGDKSYGSVLLENSANSSYRAKNINLTSNLAAMPGIYAKNAKYVNITADEGSWNNITTNGYSGKGITLTDMIQESTISNTKIYTKSHSSYGIYADGSSTSVTLDNVEINLSTDISGGTAIHATNGANISNEGKGGVTITSDNSGSGISAALRADMGGTIKLHNANIEINKTGTFGAPLRVDKNSSITLSDSSISSLDNNYLIYSNPSSGSNNTVNLNNVNLDNAKNQVIYNNSYGDLNVNLSGGTAFNGYVVTAYGANATNMDLKNGASWDLTHVTSNPELGNGTLSLDGSSSLNFTYEKYNFQNITGAAIMLETGAVINIDTRSYAGPEEKVFHLLNFTDMSGIQDGVIVNFITGDPKYAWDYSKLFTDGTISVGLATLVPEPATATLGFIGLAALALRRRKTA